MLGHELRNPLAPIVTALQLLRRRGSDPMSPEHEIIERQVKHLATLVDDSQALDKGSTFTLLLPLTNMAVASEYAGCTGRNCSLVAR
jgi:hypothetical protein